MAEKYVVYTRVSGSVGSNQDLNFSRTIQAENCNKYGEHKGCDKYGEYHDSQTGTEYENRLDVQKVLALLRAKLVQHVIFNVIDRIGRDMAVIEKFITDIYDLGGSVSVASSGVTYASADTCIMDNFFEIAVADYERRKINKRTADGRLKAFKLGSYAKRAPFGYETFRQTEILDGKKMSMTRLQPITSNANTICQILECYAEHRTRSGAVRFANGTKLLHNSEPKASWQLRTISQMIDFADAYAGIPQNITLYDPEARRHIRKSGKPLSVKENPEISYVYPQIISRELAEKVRIAKSINDGLPVNTEKPKPFRHLVYCAKCGKRAQYQGNRKEKCSKFVCTTYMVANSDKLQERAESPSEVHRGNINPVFFERCLRTYLSDLNSDEFLAEIEIELMMSYVEALNLKAQLADIEFTISEVEKNRRALTEKLVMLDMTEYPDLLLGLNEKFKASQEKIDALRNLEPPVRRGLLAIETVFASLDIKIDDDFHFPLESDWEFTTEDLATLERLSAKLSPHQLLWGNYSALIPEFKFVVRSRMDKLYEAVEHLKLSLDARDWERVGYHMAFLGLRFYADFSEQGRTKRRQSVRLSFSFQTDRKNLDVDSGSTIGHFPNTLATRGEHSQP